MQLVLMNWFDVVAYLKEDDRIVIPIGSTEQHGPFCLFGTDHLISHRISIEAALRAKVITTPAIPYGISPHHMEFPGTITLQPETLISLINETIQSLIYHGFKRFLIFNGHGGNRTTVDSGLNTISNENLSAQIKFRNWWDFIEVENYIDENFGEREGHHGTPSETSIMMFLFPEKVVKKPVEYRKTVRSSSFANRKDYKRLYPDGLIGSDPNLASKDHGKKLFELCVNGLVNELSKW